MFLDTHEQKNNWDILLTLLCYAHNSSVHNTSQGYSPAELFFGKKRRVPIDVFYESNKFSQFCRIEWFSQNLYQMLDIVSYEL